MYELLAPFGRVRARGVGKYGGSVLACVLSTKAFRVDAHKARSRAGRF